MSWEYTDDGGAVWVDDYDPERITPGPVQTEAIPDQDPSVQPIQSQLDNSEAVRRWLATPAGPTNPLRNVIEREGIQIPDGYEATLQNGRVVVTKARPALREGLLAGGALLGGGALASGVLGAAGVGGGSTGGSVSIGHGLFGGVEGATGAGAGAGAGASTVGIPTISGTAIGTGAGTLAPTVTPAALGGGGFTGFLKGLGGSLWNKFKNKDAADVAGDLAQWGGDVATGRAAGRAADVDATTKANTTELQRATLEGNLREREYQNLMNQYSLEATMPDLRASQVLRGGLMANAQDVTASHPRAQVTHFSGGLRPSAFGPGRVEAGNKLAQIGMSKLGNETFPDIPAVVNPNMLEMPQSGAMDKILATAVPGTALYNILFGTKDKGKEPTPASPAPTAPTVPGTAPAPTAPAQTSTAPPIPDVQASWSVNDQTSPIGNVNLPLDYPQGLGADNQPTGAQRFSDLLKRVRF